MFKYHSSGECLDILPVEALKIFRAKAFFDPYNVEVLNDLALEYVKVGCYKEACYYFDLCNKLGGFNSVSFSEYVYSLQKRKRWRKLIGVCQKGISSADVAGQIEILNKIGFAYSQLKEFPKASEFFKKGIQLGGEATKFDYALLENDVERFLPRKYILSFLDGQMSRIINLRDQLVDDANKRSVDKNFKIFMYWGQGFLNAPDIVKACVEKNVRHNGERVVLLDDVNLSEWVKVPNFVFAKENMSKAHFSDLIRLLILSQRGGVWADATCFLKDDMGVLLGDISIDDFFVYRKNDHQISNWFIFSEPQSYLLNMMLASMLVYWEKHEEAIDYFFFHHIFECLLLIDEDFNSAFQKVPYITRSASLKMARILGEPYVAGKVNQTLDAAFVHKLTHKYHRKYKGQDFGQDSLLSRIIDGDI